MKFKANKKVFFFTCCAEHEKKACQRRVAASTEQSGVDQRQRSTHLQSKVDQARIELAYDVGRWCRALLRERKGARSEVVRRTKRAHYRRCECWPKPKGKNRQWSADKEATTMDAIIGAKQKCELDDWSSSKCCVGVYVGVRWCWYMLVCLSEHTDSASRIFLDKDGESRSCSPP